MHGNAKPTLYTSCKRAPFRREGLVLNIDSEDIKYTVSQVALKLTLPCEGVQIR